MRSPRTGDTVDTESDDDGRSSPSGRLDPQLFLVLEGARPLAGSSRHSLAEIDEVAFARGPERRVRREPEARRLVLEVPDARMSSCHARMARVDGGWTLEDAASTNGSRVNGARASADPLQDGDVLELGHTVFMVRTRLSTPPGAPDDVSPAELEARPPGLATLLPSLAASFDALAAVSAGSEVSILLLGETGTGKEVLARTIHALSGRPGAFVAVSCGALSESQLERQLFGGAPGGAEDDPGLVRAADRGTLFLDQLGDLPRASQAAILRVLEAREVVPIGSTRAIPIDVRVVAATNAPIEAMSDAGDFRSDLFARLAGYVFRLEPLRGRKEDLGLLLAALLPKIFSPPAEVPKVSPQVARALLRHAWPRNVRELVQCLSVASALAGEGCLELEHLPESFRRERSTGPSLDDETLRLTLIAKLEEHRGNITRIARSMGKARMQIQRWVKRFGIDPEVYRQ